MPEALFRHRRPHPRTPLPSVPHAQTGEIWDLFLESARTAVNCGTAAFGGNRARAVRALATELARQFEPARTPRRTRVTSRLLESPVREWLGRWDLVSSDAEMDLRRRRLGPEAMARFHEAFAGGAGCVYTEPSDVRFMARRALAEYLAASRPDVAALPREKAFRFVGAREGVIGRVAARLRPAERRAAGIRLERLRVLDAACGSGAFLIGLLDEILRLRSALERDFFAEAAAQVVSGNLFGVDIDAAAVEVARRRLALAAPHAHPNLIVGDALRLDVIAGFPNALDGGPGRDGGKGFDIVIGNPPYLRQERIARHSHLTPDARGDAREAVSARWEREIGISRRADLYVYFFLEGLRLLRPGGTLVFLTSHAWLDLDYGAALRRFLLEEADLSLILESDHRSFRHASVNTIVTVAIRRPGEGDRRKIGSPAVRRNGGRPVRFVRLHRSLAQASEGPLFAALDQRRNVDSPALRLRIASVRELAPAAPGEPTPRWGGLWLRGPDVIFRLRERETGRTVPLGKIAEVVFGLKTGCNDFFYLEDVGAVAGTRGALRQCRSRLDGHQHVIESRFLSPVVTTLKEVPGLRVDPVHLRRRLLMIPAGARLSDTHVKQYLMTGERLGVHRRPSVAGRNPWFALIPPRGMFLIPRRIGERMPIPRTDGVAFDNNLFGITPRSGIPPASLQAILNSTLTRLYVELGARELTGAQAVVDTNVYLVKAIPVPHPDLLRSRADDLARLFESLYARNACSIFDELGAGDRSALDTLVLSLHGLPGREASAVQEAVADLVGRRLAKAAGAVYKSVDWVRRPFPSMA